jgi:predicted negative regulator of RcsB-dependent stress response
MTEDEQLEVMKKWWKRYGNTITIILSIILLCFAGYRYMNWHNEKLTHQASITYEQMMNALSNQNNESVIAYANQLITDYNRTVYADVAHMNLSKIYVSKNNLDRAKNELIIVANKSKMTALKQIAKIRIARILAAEKSYTKALNELSTIDDKIYMPVVNELKGDIYGATGKYQEAIDAYRQAINEVKTNGMGNLFLEMKTNELASKAQSLLSNNKKMQAA